VRRTKADSGTVIVQDVHTGEILAMATGPPSTRTTRCRAGRGPWQPCGAQVYEPGSIGKAITMSALLDSGRPPRTPRSGLPGTLPRAGHVLHDDVNHGWNG